MRKELAFFASPDQDCPYLPEQTSGMLFVDPHAALDSSTYSHLVRLGFRRSGDYVYRPKCQHCSACLPTRIPVAQYRPRRTQRRNWQRNAGIQVIQRMPEFDPEHYALYERYVRLRHPGGGMDDPAPDQYLDFLNSSWGDTRFYEFRENGQLLAVAVVDHLSDALSAVYTFYEPALRPRGLGVYAVQWQIRHARELGLRHVYLGYLVKGCRKMSYKAGYRPLEVLVDRRWMHVASGEEVPEPLQQRGRPR